MLTKLTLTIDQDVIARAKRYAKKKHRSVSKIVEDYLKNVSEIEDKTTSGIQMEASITDGITGMFKQDYNGNEYQEILENALLEKFK